MGFGFVIFACVRDAACGYNTLYACYNITGHNTSI